MDTFLEVEGLEREHWTENVAKYYDLGYQAHGFKTQWGLHNLFEAL